MVSVVATSLVTTPMAKRRTPGSCSGSCMSSNHLNVNFPDLAPRSASTMGALSHNTFSTNSSNPEGVVMSTLSASLKKWEKDPCTLFSVSQSISVTGQFSAWKKSTRDVMRVLLPPPPFPPHRHDNSFLIIGFVTHFLALLCLLKFLRLERLIPCRVLGG